MGFEKREEELGYGGSGVVAVSVLGEGEVEDDKVGEVEDDTQIWVSGFFINFLLLIIIIMIWK